jgi:hypothetical protein
MSLLKTISVCVALVIVSTAAVAFQEQQSGTSTAPAQAPAAAAPKPVELSPTAESLKSSVGTEVRVPGLGKLGNLPKMDFGLELLYGASEQKQPDSQPREDARDDLTIRGTVKHKF